LLLHGIILPQNKKKPFEQSAAKDKVRSANQRQEYQKTLPPKRPPTGYFAFLKDFRAKNPIKGGDVTEFTKSGSVAWKTLQGSVRDNYNAKAKQALETWKANNGNKKAV